MKSIEQLKIQNQHYIQTLITLPKSKNNIKNIVFCFFLFIYFSTFSHVTLKK